MRIASTHLRASQLRDPNAVHANIFVTSRSLTYRFAEMADALTQMAVFDALTDKQREVITYVSEGLTSKEIARKLGVSESAVNQRIEVIRQRLGGLPRAQIARLYRRQSTLLLTIPTSNSLTGNPIQLLSLASAGQAGFVEGAADRTVPGAGPGSGVLQPSTISRSTISLALDGPARLWFRLGAIVLLAAGIAATALLVLSVAATLAALLGP